MTLGVVVRKVEDLELYEGVEIVTPRVSKSHKKQTAGSRLFKYCAGTLAALQKARMLNRISTRINQ